MSNVMCNVAGQDPDAGASEVKQAMHCGMTCTRGMIAINWVMYVFSL